MTMIKLTNLCGTVPLTCLNKCHKATIFINAYVAIHSINHTKLSYRIKILQYAPRLAILCVILNTVKESVFTWPRTSLSAILLSFLCTLTSLAF